MADWMTKIFGGSGRDARIAQITSAIQAQQAEAARQAQQAQLIEQQRQANEILAQQSAASQQAQREADAAAYRASLTPGDSEEGRQSSERKTRRLLSARGFASTMVRGALGDAPVATRQLLGA